MRISMEHMDRVAFCDPAGGKTVVKRGKARSAIVVLGQDHSDRIFLWFAWAAHCTTDKLIDKLFEVNDLYHPRRFGIEANAMQSIFADAVRREARLKVASIPFEDVVQPSHLEKPFRNRAAIQPVLAVGRMLMQSSQVEAHNELATHPMAMTCDIVDCIATAIGLLPRRALPADVNHRELDLFRYLRKTGAPAWYIDKKLAELKGVHSTDAIPPRH